MCESATAIAAATTCCCSSVNRYMSYLQSGRNQVDRQGQCRPERAHEREPGGHVLEQPPDGRGVPACHEDLDVNAPDPRWTLLTDDLGVGNPVFKPTGAERRDAVDVHT